MILIFSVKINFETNSKRIELKPFIYDNHPCNTCLYSAQTHALSKTRPHLDSESFETSFCGSLDCLQYYCEACWQRRHSFLPLSDSSGLLQHRPLQKETLDTEPTVGMIQRRQDIRKSLTHGVLGNQLNQVMRLIRSPKETREEDQRKI
ncbi:MAG: Cpb-1p [Marteilia pararefringens]